MTTNGNLEHPATVTDPALPTLRDALDPRLALAALTERLRLPVGRTRLASLRVLAHKPGKRCVIEYALDIESSSASARLEAIGKIRVNRFGNSGYRQLRAIWQAGFTSDSADGICVPDPLGTVPSLCMWLQRKVPGRTVTSVLRDGSSPSADRIAAAVHKLHNAPLTADRCHTMDDELRILHRCLDTVAAQHPHAAEAVFTLMDTAARVGGLLPVPAFCPSHRDFYSDQVMLHDDRVYLIDFDLFCLADPGLDVGNFLGHLTEHALRFHGDAAALQAFEDELEDRFVARAGEATRYAVRVYAALTLARHVFLSTQFADRAHLMLPLAGLAQARLASLSAAGGHP